MKPDLESLPPLPLDCDGPQFREPWEAHAFALALLLHERGLYTWTEWATALATQIRGAQVNGDPDLGDGYYRHWLGALETLASSKGASSTAELTRYGDAWDHAAERTTHGQPIDLQASDFDPE